MMKWCVQLFRDKNTTRNVYQFKYLINMQSNWFLKQGCGNTMPDVYNLSRFQEDK